RKRRHGAAAGGVKVVHPFPFCDSREGARIFSVELYLRVRQACAGGMSQRQAAKAFNISRDTVAKMMTFSVPPGYRRTAEVRRPKLDPFIPIIEGWLEPARRPAPCWWKRLPRGGASPLRKFRSTREL